MRVLLLALVVSACAVPTAAPDPGPTAPVPPKVVRDVDIDEEVVCDYGYCGEHNIAAAAGIDHDRYKSLSVVPIGRRAAEDLADRIARTFAGVKRPDVELDARDCALGDVCISGEYEAGTIFLYAPSVGTLLHEVAHHVSATGPYLALDIAADDRREHSDGFEWALLEVYLAYLAADLDHAAIELPPLPQPSRHVVGDCVDPVTYGPTDCGAEHAGRVVASVMLVDGPWPGASTLDRRAEDACDGAAGLDGWNELFLPTELGWRQGDREVVCVVDD